METWKTIYTVVRERKEFSIKKKKSKKSKIKKEFMNWSQFIEEREEEFHDLMQYVISPFLDCEERYDMKTVNKFFYRLVKKYWRLEFKNGLYYVGEVILKPNENYEGYYNCKYIPHGEGKMVYPNGSMYQGKWKNGCREGKGKMFYASSDMYQGQWVDGRRSGQGKMVWNNGQMYQGEFDNGNEHGFGRMIYASGNAYKGEWKLGHRMGQGKMVWSNGNVYQGEWKYGYKQGQGKMSYQNGSIYNGKWKHGKQFTQL